MSAGDWKDMCAAAVASDLPLVRYPVAAGVNPNYQHPEILCTPLVASLIHGHGAMTHCLLEQGADPQLRSELDGMTTLQAVRRHGRTDFIALLQARGVRDPRAPWWWRWLPL
jgi:ankyrin repeat protein